MVPVQQFMPDAVAALLRKAPLTPEKVAFAWRSAVGATVDQATAIALRDGVLHVVARDAAWQHELERSAAMIRVRLETLLGTEVIRYINVTVRWGVGLPQTPDPLANVRESYVRFSMAPAAAAPAR